MKNVKIVFLILAVKLRNVVDAAAQYKLVTSETCAFWGLEEIYDTETCKSAANNLGKAYNWGPNGGYKDVVNGCSFRSNGSLFLNGEGTCDPSHRIGEWTYTGCKCTQKHPCLCENLYRLVTNADSCAAAGHANVYGSDACKDAAKSFGKTFNWGPYGGYTDVVDGCSFRSNGSLFLNNQGKCDPNHRIGEWTYTGCRCEEKQACLCIFHCPAGYYCTDGMEKKICPVGYYCPGGTGKNGIKIKCANYSEYCPRTGMSEPENVCPTNLYGPQCESEVKCLTNRGRCDKADDWGSCYNFYGNGRCNGCDKDHSGAICEHNVCRNSHIGPDLASMYKDFPAAFDFSLYKAEDLTVTQESETDGDFGIRVKYRPISSDIKEHRLLINNSDMGISSGAVPECSEDGPAQNASLPLYSINEPVGTKLNICLRGIWKESTLGLTGGTWKSLSSGSLEARPNPKQCTDYTIQYQTRITFSVRDLYNTVNIEGAKVRYSVGGAEFEGTTDKLGRISAAIIVPDMVANSERAALVVRGVTSFNNDADADFVLCASPPQAGTACEESQQRTFPLQDPIVTEHLNQAPQEIFIVDKKAVRVTGKVGFQVNPAGDSCGIGGITVVAKNANLEDTGSGSNILVETTTNEAGEFEIAVPKQTLVHLEMTYNNHTFVGGDNDSISILSDNGLLITDEKEGLVFQDITTSEISITSAVTDCMFDIGNYDFVLEIPNCPIIQVPAEASNGRESFTVTVPAHKYKFSLMRFDGVPDVVDGATLLERFEYMFPSSDEEEFDKRTLDVTNETATVRFIYHPDPVVNMEIGQGIFSPETYPTDCGEDPAPFDFAVEANNLVSLRFTFRQTYKQDFCDKLPSFSTLKVLSNLGQPLDPCSALTGGCSLEPKVEEDQGRNLTIARTFVFAGSPTTFGDNSDGKTIVDYVGTNKIGYSLANPTYFQSENVFVGSSKILILGNKPITEDSLVSFFSEDQDHVPLLYLNAPPPGVGISSAQTSTQTVTLNLAMTSVTKTFASTDIRAGGGGYIGIKSKGNAFLCIPFVGCAIKIAEGEQTFKEGLSNFDTKTTGYSDDVQTAVQSQGLKLTTPKGMWGKNGDMVLLIGSVADFITSILVSFDGCQIRESPSVVWGATTESLLFYSRTDVELEFDKLEKTIRDSQYVLEDVNAPEAARVDAERLIRISENSKKKWNALFEHWENDRRQARNHKVDLRGLVTGVKGNPLEEEEEALNRFTFGSSEVTLSRTVKMSDSSVLDYTSTGDVFSSNTQYDFSLLFGSGFIAGPVGGGNFEYTKTTKSVFSTTQQESNSMTVSAYLTENNAGDKLCVDVYESPHSGTFVFEVCGGETRCPHVPGTDAREQFRLNVIEQPTGALLQDKGRIVLEVDTFDMASSLDDLDIVLELDSQTVLFPVRFDIGSASLNQPLEFTLDARTRTPFYILFERLDPNLQSIQISGSVSSRCDSSIQERFSFTVEWASQCPPVRWGGDLAASAANFKITSVEPDLAVSAVNPLGTRWRDTKDVNVDVSLWIRPFDRVTEPWVVVPNNFLRIGRERDSSNSANFVDQEDNTGSATLWLSADTNSLFRQGERYEFELRSSCTVTINGEIRAAGESRSGPRLGVVDLFGPEIISWSSTPVVNVPTLGVPVAKVIFNEAIDCSHPSLAAVISVADGSLSTSTAVTNGQVYCTGRAQQLHVVLPLASQADVNVWSGQETVVDIIGLRDVHGNLYGRHGQLSSPGTLPTTSEVVTKSLFLRSNSMPKANNVSIAESYKSSSTEDIIRMTPSVPLLLDVDDDEAIATNPWIMPTQEELESMVQTERHRLLPPGLVLPAANTQSSDMVELSKLTNSNDTNGSTYYTSATRGAIAGSTIVGMVVASLMAGMMLW